MDELIKALVGLINQGSALAAPALYLFFALKAFNSLTVAVPFTTAIVLVYRLIRRRLDTPSEQAWECLRKGEPITVYSEYGPHKWSPSPSLMRRFGFIQVRESGKSAGAVDPDGGTVSN